VGSKYLQPRWCPPGLTRSQKRKLQRLRLAEMRKKEREKWRDDLFDEIKPRTPLKQEWRRKEALQSCTAEAATGGQTAAPGSQTAVDPVPGGQTALPEPRKNAARSQAEPARPPPREASRAVRLELVAVRPWAQAVRPPAPMEPVPAVVPT
jgi:hypothetical protein